MDKNTVTTDIEAPESGVVQEGSKMDQTSEPSKMDQPSEPSKMDQTSELASAEEQAMEVTEGAAENSDVVSAITTPTEGINEKVITSDTVDNNPVRTDDEDRKTAGKDTETSTSVSNPANDEPASMTTELASDVETVRYPNYDFESPHEILNSESFFTPDQYLDSCKWSPDGSCLLTCCADRRLRLFDLPSEAYNLKEMNPSDKLTGPFKPTLTVSENGAVYDYEWFPFMSSWAPETACFISASSSAPVHLIDAFTGAVRASYIGYNNVFEVASCFGLTFTCDGGKIYCGYRNMIKIFDVAVPGTTSQTLNTKKLNQQTGYISCIAQNPSLHSLFAAGSFSRTIGLYTVEGDAVCLLKGQRNGLTTLAFTPDGTKLFSGSRMDSEILCWDLRNPGEVLHVLPRVMETNQRIRISLSCDGNHLLSGGTDGVVSIWNLEEVSRQSGLCEPTHKFKAHNDCVNGVSLNAKFPILASSSGKRHTPDLVSDDESDQVFSYENYASKTENRVALWWVGPNASSDPSNP